MTKQELLDSIALKFNKVGTEKKMGEEIFDGIRLEHFAIPVFDIINNVIIRQWIHFYVDESGDAYWQEREPKPTIVPTVSFTDEVLAFIKTKIDDNTIKFGSLKNILENVKKATVEVVMPDKNIRTVIVSKVGENFTLEVL